MKKVLAYIMQVLMYGTGIVLIEFGIYWFVRGVKEKLRRNKNVVKNN